MNQMPRYSAVMVIAFFAALGLPGLSGFISEAFSLLGAFQTFRTLTIIAAVTIVLTAGYMLWVLQRVFLGTLPEKWKGLTDMNLREGLMLVPLAAIVIFLGIYPGSINWPRYCSTPVLLQCWVSTNTSNARATPTGSVICCA
jgi:NADH-quinone oxidoreductase subunit M